jgi:hypothetical protein
VPTWLEVLPKLTSTQLLREDSSVMELGYSLSPSQDPITSPHPLLNESTQLRSKISTNNFWETPVFSHGDS